MVDDNADEIFLTWRIMRREGIVNNFVSEKNPERLFETLIQLNKSGVDKRNLMILLDVNMPGVNGFETLKKIRESSDFKDTPVIMLSTSDEESDIYQSVERGANGYLVKPFKADEFFAALTNVRQIKHQLAR
jgi:two-component system response regulator